jgi:hypothetical protein
MILSLNTTALIMPVKSFIVQFLKLLSLSFLELVPSNSETLKLFYSKTWLQVYSGESQAVTIILSLNTVALIMSVKSFIAQFHKLLSLSFSELVPSQQRP